jgi:hypothetical protein
MIKQESLVNASSPESDIPCETSGYQEGVKAITHRITGGCAKPARKIAGKCRKHGEDMPSAIRAESCAHFTVGVGTP